MQRPPAFLWLLEPRKGLAPLPSPEEAASFIIQREADRLVLERYSPPGVIVDEAFTVLQYRGKTDPYLGVPSGKPSLNLLKMLRAELSAELRGAVRKAKRTGRPVAVTNVPVALSQQNCRSLK